MTELESQVEKLTAALEEARRAGTRQAAPFARGQPKADAKKPGRKPGEAYGPKAHRPPPAPEAIDEVHEAPLPATCPDCGGAIAETHVADQFQTEIPRKPITRQFRIHVGQCQRCGTRVQGRHPLQTSDALGAAASQLGPQAPACAGRQAAVVQLNKEPGLPAAAAGPVVRQSRAGVARTVWHSPDARRRGAGGVARGAAIATDLSRDWGGDPSRGLGRAR